MDSFEKFGEAFQKKIIYHIINDSKFALQVLDILKPDFFSNENFGVMIQTIVEWNKQYTTIPSFENLTTIFNTKIEDEIKREYLLGEINDISKREYGVDKKFIVEETVKFCKQQAMKRAILESVNLLDKEDYDRISQIVQRALMVGQTRDIGHMYVKNVLGRTTARRHPIPTGFPMLDEEYIAGGLSSGELGLIMGGTGVGKSFMLAHLAYACFMNGGTPLIYSFELQEIPFGMRLDSKITGIPLTKLMLDADGKYRKQVEAKVQEISSRFVHKPEIIIKEFPTMGSSIADLKNHLAQLRAMGINPSMIIVDYADLIKPTRKYGEYRFEIDSIIKELRGWAGEESLPLWSATQTNRDGLDVSIVALKTISEALAKAFTADLVISIGRSPRLRELGMACYFLAKSRMGEDKVAFTGLFDTTCMNFTIDEVGLDEEDLENRDRQHDVNTAVRNVLDHSSNILRSGSVDIASLLKDLED